MNTEVRFAVYMGGGLLFQTEWMNVADAKRFHAVMKSKLEGAVIQAQHRDISVTSFAEVL